MALLSSVPVMAPIPFGAGYVIACQLVTVANGNAADEWFEVHGVSKVIAVLGVVLTGVTAVAANIPALRVRLQGTGGGANDRAVAVEADATTQWYVTVLGLP